MQLWQKIAQTQTTTALLTASALQPSSATGYSSFATVYDECRCLGITFHCSANSGTLTTVDSWAVSYDPGISTNLSSVVEALEARYKIGPNVLACSANGSPTMATASKTGFFTMHAKTVKSVSQGADANPLIGSQWVATTSTYIAGYLKPYVENGAGGTVYLQTFVCYDMEFKYRG